MKIFLFFLILVCISANADQNADDAECGLCMKVVIDVLEDLKGAQTDDISDDAMKGAFEKLCGTFPSILLENCNYFIEKYTNGLIEIIKEDKYPVSACIRLKVCEEQ